MADALTKEDLDKFFMDERDRLANQRRAEDLKTATAPMRERLLEHVRKHGGRDRTTVCHGYVLAIKTRAGFPAYKEAFIAHAGVDAAEELRKTAKPTETISIEKAA